MAVPFLSIVSPVYRAEKLVQLLVEKIKEGASPITENFEIILVEDGGPDNSWSCIMNEAAKDERVKGIKLSRNFGQHYAITAGLDHAKGEWVVIMDCDLQDDPAEMIKLYNKAKEGHKIVFGRRAVRQDSFSKKFTSRMYYKVISFLTGVRQDPAIANYGIYHCTVIDAVNQMREPFRSFGGMIKWVGFSPVTIDINHSKRAEGKSTYNFKRLLLLGMDSILSYSNKPLYFIVACGFVVSAVAFFISLITIIRYLTGSIAVIGYTSLILSIWILGGLIIMFIGILGLYIGKIFEGIKNRPIYITESKLNFD